MKITSQFSRLKIRSFLLFWRVRILWRLTSTVSQSVKNFLMYPNMKNLRRVCCWFSSWIRLSINLLDAEVYQKKISTRLTFCITAISIAGCGELDRQCESHLIFATDRCGHTWRYVFNFVVISWEAALSSWDYCSRLTLHHIVTRNGGEYNYRYQRSATIIAITAAGTPGDLTCCRDLRIKPLSVSPA